MAMTDKQREEWIDKKTLALFARLLNIHGPVRNPLETREAIRDFICTLLDEAPMRKVSRIELSDLASDIMDSITTSRVVGVIMKYLKSKDIEVEE